jgi:hypothetical protein
VGGGGRHKQEGITEHAPRMGRGGGAQRGGAAPLGWRSSGGTVSSWQIPVRDDGIRHREAALGRGGVRGRGRALQGG